MSDDESDDSKPLNALTDNAPTGLRRQLGRMGLKFPGIGSDVVMEK